MAEKQSVQKNPALVAEYERRVAKLWPGKGRGFVEALWQGFSNYKETLLEYRWNRRYHFDALHTAYKALCGGGATQCPTVADFFCPKLTAALNAYFGHEEADRIRAECALAMEFPYSHTAYRPAYRSRHAGDYADVFFMVMVNAIDFACYGQTVEQALATRDALLAGLDNRAAMALRQGNGRVLGIIEEAILGDNSTQTLSHLMISAIVKSGHGPALELLGKLLLAAKGQEGLRQAILETCDSGTPESHTYFIGLILEHGLCRFSSVIRAFDTWSGLGFGDQKQRVAEKCMALAGAYLSDEAAVSEGLASPDTTEIYLALWALCCRDLHSATRQAQDLLKSPEKYRRLVGWYFITHTNSAAFRHALGAAHLDVREPQELAWVCANLHQSSLSCYTHGWDEEKERSVQEKRYPDDIYPADAARRGALFEQAAAVADFIGKATTRFDESVFPWCTVTLNADAVCGLMLSLAAYERDSGLIQRVAGLLPLMESRRRLAFYGLLLNPKIPAQRALLVEGLSDKSKTVRELVAQRLQHYPLTETDTDRLTAALTTQGADLRKGIITLLSKQREAVAGPVIHRLLAAPGKNQQMAGVELLDIFAKENPALLSRYQDALEPLRSDEKLAQDMSILLKRLSPGAGAQAEPAALAGYGLYDPESPAFNAALWSAKRPPVPQMASRQLARLIVPGEADVLALYRRMAAVFHRYRNYEYETESYSGTREKVLLGSQSHGLAPLAGHERGPKGYTLHDLPLAEQWLEAAGEYARDKRKLMTVLSLWSGRPGYNKVYLKWFKNLFADFPLEPHKDSMAHRLSEYIRAFIQINRILEAMMETGGGRDFDFAFSAYVNLVRMVPQGRLGDACEAENEQRRVIYSSSHDNRDGNALSALYLHFWRNQARRAIENDDQFTAYFNELWAQYLLSGRQAFHGLTEGDIFRAHSLGLIPRDAVCMYLTDGADAPMHMRDATCPQGRELLEQYPMVKPLLERTVDCVVTVEENRGELPTPLTKVAARIHRFTGGIGHFVNLLAALGDTGFHRGYAYTYFSQGDLTKKECLSHLLRICQIAPEDTAQALGAALKAAKITEKRIIQAAVYAPQWAGLLEEAAGITGLKCGVWFFHAHVNDSFSAQKETEAALYSAITPQSFMDGAFDKDWFLQAHGALGEKRFNELYKNAKYITGSGSAHRRSQLYADAVLGRLDREALKAEITQKRNQEKLRAFALIPLDEQDSGDALERYAFIQQFKKESRQFGSMRQANESKACGIALDNLAITTGYGDADRMTWAMEGAKIELLRPLMTPHLLGETQVWLAIDEAGDPRLAVSKNGKALKALPKELAKNETVLDIKEAVKQLRDQKRRARLSFEQAMVARSPFSPGEIAGLLGHPVLGAMVSTLVLTQDARLGFPVLEGDVLRLEDAEGGRHTAAESALIIAHPYDFMNGGCWSAFQQKLYRSRTVQPFKQVYREYYPITQDEREAVNLSRRYAGNQVQPKKTVALLKTRGWTVDYEEGLQRVWHKENLVARMYALADWFSPADIEAPTLETVQFFRRQGWALAPFADISPVIFSETMRDIDLAVSVAHVGGVDPEASHSTVDMRIAIARELLALLEVDCVTFQSAHAHIRGSMGEYSVHMGSGVVHQAGRGMLAVLPVHAQARGRIFLPFADEDPKTAEILSKILLFADDRKIKDPGILSQIQG